MEATVRARLPALKETRFQAKLRDSRRLLKTTRSNLMVHHYPSMQAFVRAIKRDEVPEDLVSPGWVANQCGISRQAVHAAIIDGRVDAWKVTGGYVFVRVDAVKEFR